MSQNRIGAFIVLAFSVFYGCLALQLSIVSGLDVLGKPAILPLILSIAGIVVSALLYIFPSQSVSPDLKPAVPNLFRVAGLSVLMLIYGLTMTSLGFVIATVLFLATGFWIMGERQLKIIFSISGTVSVFFWLILTQVLGIHLDTDWISQLVSRFIN
jgi:putative tricarboxylic transport membrane protein